MDTFCGISVLSLRTVKEEEKEKGKEEEDGVW
jgi:hypothetical protein